MALSKGKLVLVNLIAFYLVLFLLEQPIKEFVDILEVQSHVDVALLLADEGFGQRAVEGIQEEEELVSADPAGGFEAEDVHDSLEVGLV